MVSHPNRGRIAVEPGEGWRLYTSVLPAGAVPVGVVVRGVERGALVRLPQTGLYAQVNAGVVRALDQRKVKAALGEKP